MDIFVCDISKTQQTESSRKIIPVGNDLRVRGEMKLQETKNNGGSFNMFFYFCTGILRQPENMESN